ncbi:heavy metal translocating P-type ATPase [Laspinema olomoucense]|uniref:heavy metal translocating P-type ATPase n=1 Tax=Laspinema olomoucense TaxID=3231600 RepID=UPI0021BA87C4|nr:MULTISPECIES: heavy metal translocating P-type ATPase [unclassified Laspinema]MCT7988800.1 heavy metal translocating P-type ATPase [Laspinema sp. D3a]MCT7995902.1 heavy metal translocating P-type ATPase [Laspinema sp. D3c]
MVYIPIPLQKRLPPWVQTYPEAIAAGFCAGLTMLGWLALQMQWLGLGVWMLFAAYVIGGYASAREGLTTLWQERELDVDLLMIVAALGAAALGLWQQDYHLLVDGAVLILIFALSGALENIAMHRTERNIRSLMQLTPDTARVLVQGQEKQVATADLRVGDRILIKPGDLIPTDGLVAQGDSTVNQAPITGESIPVEKTLGDEVFAGTINGSGVLLVDLHKPPESSLIQRVIQLVEQAKTTQPPSQQFLERFERGYARVIVGAGVLLATLPPLILGWAWDITIYRALVFLVVASPCALMASIMPALLSGIARGARQGILFKDGALLETIGQVKAIAFDKTGTLTTGLLNVSDQIPAPGVTPEQLLQIAASLETYSEHPIAQAVVAAAHQRQIPLHPAAAVQASVGRGISGELDGLPMQVGKLAYISTDLATPVDPTLVQASQRLEAAGKTVIWVRRQQQVLGLLAVADQVRPQSAQLLQTLRRRGIMATVMLTGDNRATAETVATETGVTEVYADLLPEDKVKVIKLLQQQYGTVAMVGDGINDAPALAQASVGIAMGTAGSDVALETADIVLMADRLEKLEQAIVIGQRSQRIIWQNITLALVSISLLMVANFLGELTLPVGVLGHEGSTLLVTLNGLRMLRD